MNPLNDEIKWSAVKNSSQEYDGIFFYAVRSTKICCRPSCKSRTPLRRNVSFFSSLPQAIQEGYRPCKRCRPDLIDPPNNDRLIEATIQLMERDYRTSLTLDKIAVEVGMSKFHLQRLFKKATGKTPLEYMTALRLQEASLLLHTTNHTITDIAHLLGYKSSAHFASMFLQHIGKSPTAYREGRFL
jgi:AraC family transcriptional regulator, regulatory protein of adaptative response / methylphosphotriester-DNA alkyltransferase methyltransferase